MSKSVYGHLAHTFHKSYPSTKLAILLQKLASVEDYISFSFFLLSFKKVSSLISEGVWIGSVRKEKGNEKSSFLLLVFV